MITCIWPKFLDFKQLLALAHRAHFWMHTVVQRLLHM